MTDKKNNPPVTPARQPDRRIDEIKKHDRPMPVRDIPPPNIISPRVPLTDPKPPRKP